MDKTRAITRAIVLLAGGFLIFAAIFYGVLLLSKKEDRPTISQQRPSEGTQKMLELAPGETKKISVPPCFQGKCWRAEVTGSVNKFQTYSIYVGGSKCAAGSGCPDGAIESAEIENLDKINPITVFIEMKSK